MGPAPVSKADRAEVLGELRRLLARMEGVRTDGKALSFGLPTLDSHLPLGGLAYGSLHEIGPATEADLPAAFGFGLALLGRMPPGAPLLLILSSRKLARCGRPYGHGLRDLGLDPARLILVETRNEEDALWATEEALRSRVPAAIACATGARLDLKASQRLHHAARDSGLPLLLLRSAGAMGATTAATRWRIGATVALRDRFGLLARWRWHVALERCRNGRPGEWVLEFDHATHRFSLAAAVAGTSLSCSRAPPPLERTG